MRRISSKWRMPEELWERIEDLLPKPKKKRIKEGRPPLPARQVADGIFYVLRTGCQWKAAPPEFGSGTSLHRYFQTWVKCGVFWKLWQAGLMEYDELKGIKWDWQSIDGAMTKAPLGGGKNRPEPHRPRQEGHEAKPAYGWRRRTDRDSRGAGQSPRQ